MRIVYEAKEKSMNKKTNLTTILLSILFVISTNTLLDQEINIGFQDSIESDENIVCKLQVYEEEAHVPYQSLYHGLRFINE